MRRLPSDLDPGDTSQTGSSERDAPAYGLTDVVAMCLAVFDVIGPGLLIVAAVLLGVSLLARLAG